jgi:hypothetical protein
MPGSSKQGRELRGLCIPRSLPRWHDPDPLGGLSPAYLPEILKGQARRCQSHVCIECPRKKPSNSHFFRAPNGQNAETGKPPTGRQDQPSSGSQRTKPNIYF